MIAFDFECPSICRRMLRLTGLQRVRSGRPWARLRLALASKSEGEAGVIEVAWIQHGYVHEHMEKVVRRMCMGICKRIGSRAVL